MSEGKPSALQNILSPDPSELPDDFNMPIWDHLEELRERWVLTGPSRHERTGHAVDTWVHN